MKRTYISLKINKYNELEKEENVISTYEFTPLKRKSFYGKAKVLRTYKYDYLESYNTMICRYNVENNKIERLSNFRSNTTCSHIIAFLNNYKDNKIKTTKDFYSLPLKEI